MSLGRLGSSYIMHSSRKAERSSIRCLTALPFSPVAFLHDARCQMAQSSLSMPAAPRRQRLGCCSPILQFWKHIQRLVAGSDDDFRCVGLSGTLPTSSTPFSQGTTDRRTSSSNTQDGSSKSSSEVKTKEFWDEAEEIVEQKEEDTFSTDESASEFHLSEVTTIRERGETKCGEVASL